MPYPDSIDAIIADKQNYMISRIIINWIRAIRIRFLLASAIAAANGMAVAVWKYGVFDFSYAILTFAGVLCLHASVDLLNDYWDYKRGIDKITKRTKFSGGTGVLPENLLEPKMVYRIGIVFLIIGSLLGMYFVDIRGVTILIILGFAILAIYFYSTTIVNVGLGEVFVMIKGTMVVLGSFYVQVGIIEPTAIYVGVIIGLLSACVLFVNSFPDYEADRSSGRRTLVIVLGKQRAAKIISLPIIAPYVLITVGIFLGYTRLFSLICLLSTPYVFKISKYIGQHEYLEKFIPAMAATVKYARITGILLAISLLL
jgi:1,4-dihydroxy-2-naphthoate octaprenyltransferase